MHFILIAYDKPGALPLRQATRPAHLAYCGETIGEKLLFGGPLLDDEGKPNGSILVVAAADRATAEAIFAADPYAKAGLFERSTIAAFRHVFEAGRLVG